MSDNAKGFSLIELMIVVAITGIIAAIALPSYNEHVRKVRRGDAVASMMGLANALERYRANNVGQGYNGAALPDIFPDEVPADGGDVYYQLALSDLSGRTYTITAVRKGIQAQDPCGDYVLDQSGSRSLKNNKNPLSDCWP